MHVAQRLCRVLLISLLLDKPGIRVCHGQDAAIQGNLLPTQLPMMRTELRPACALLSPGVQTSSASFLVSAVLWCRPGERRSRPSFTDTSRQTPTCLRSLRSGDLCEQDACLRAPQRLDNLYDLVPWPLCLLSQAGCNQHGRLIVRRLTRLDSARRGICFDTGLRCCW